MASNSLYLFVFVPDGITLVLRHLKINEIRLQVSSKTLACTKQTMAFRLEFFITLFEIHPREVSNEKHQNNAPKANIKFEEHK